jgi:SNF2 family DNA or RNA helicase
MRTDKASKLQTSRPAKHSPVVEVVNRLQFSNSCSREVHVVPTQAQAANGIVLPNSGSDRHIASNGGAPALAFRRADRKYGQELHNGQASEGSRVLEAQSEAREGRHSSRSVLHPNPQLRPYQQEGVEFLLARRGAILADVMGAGKTPQLVAAASAIIAIIARHSAYAPVRVLVIATKHNLLNWQREIQRWSSLRVPVVLYAGPHRKYPDYPNCWIVTNFGLEHEILERDPKASFTVLIVDEAHKARNRKTKRFANLQALAKRSEYVWLATGTPIRNHPVDLIPQAMLIKVAKAYWPVVGQFFAMCASQFGSGKEIGGLKSVTAFRQWCSTFLLCRTKKVIPNLPSRTRKQLFVQMTPQQTKMYGDLLVELAALVGEAGDELLLVPNRLSLCVRLRQLLVAPELLGAAFHGGAMAAVKAWTKDFVEEGLTGVIFTPFRKAIPYIDKATGLKSNQIAHFTGSMSLHAIERQQRLFESEGCKLAVCTIQVCEGFSLTKASEALFVGAEWTMAANEQAEDRLWRFGQERPVRIQYIAHQGTIEEDLIALLETKASYAAILKEVVKWH